MAAFSLDVEILLPMDKLDTQNFVAGPGAETLLLIIHSNT